MLYAWTIHNNNYQIIKKWFLTESPWIIKLQPINNKTNYYKIKWAWSSLGPLLDRLFLLLFFSVGLQECFGPLVFSKLSLSVLIFSKITIFWKLFSKISILNNYFSKILIFQNYFTNLTLYSKLFWKMTVF